MSIRTQIIIIVAVVLAVWVLLKMVKKRTISLKYALPWIALAIGIILFTGFSSCTESISRLLGVALPVNMIFFMGFCFSLLIIFTLSLAVSRLSKRIKQLAQNQALLERELKDMKLREKRDE